MISLPILLELKFPDIEFDYQVTLKDEGNGPEINAWNRLEPRPTQEDIIAWQNDPAIIHQHTCQQNMLANKSIHEELDALDSKSVRALRTNDSARLADLESQAAVLRAKLLPER